VASLSRRQLIAALAAALALPGPAAEPRPIEGELELTALHSGESIRFDFREGAGLDEDTTRRIARVLRDRRSGDEHPMDAALFGQLLRLAAAADVAASYEIISAYRSPVSNARMHELSKGVSSRSLHMEGRAMDVRLRGVDTLRLATLARALGAGGVGYYPGDRFVHVDTGRVRTWDG
jgi:uncharacterized protein YcbK (DUF882 family)